MLARQFSPADTSSQGPSTRGTKRRVPPDSFFGSDSDADRLTSTEQTKPQEERCSSYPRLSGCHERIVASLADRPDLLDHFLSVQSLSRPVNQQREESTPKRTRTSSTSEPIDTLTKTSKFQLQPTSIQRRLHRLISAQKPPGTSAHEFVDGLNHPAVDFITHLATVSRLYDFQFGTRGLSIMHLTTLKP